MKCPRCGESFTLYFVTQTRCRRCDEEVRRLVEADAKRRAPRFASPKDMTGRAA